MVSSDYMKRLGKVIREARLMKRLSINELHYRTRLAYPTLTKIEQGKTYPRVDTLLIICQVLDVRLSDLFISVDRL